MGLDMACGLLTWNFFHGLAIRAAWSLDELCYSSMSMFRIEQAVIPLPKTQDIQPRANIPSRPLWSVIRKFWRCAGYLDGITHDIAHQNDLEISLVYESTVFCPFPHLLPVFSLASSAAAAAAAVEYLVEKERKKTPSDPSRTQPSSAISLHWKAATKVLLAERHSPCLVSTPPIPTTQAGSADLPLVASSCR
jgi:hypothetical protein